MFFLTKVCLVGGFHIFKNISQIESFPKIAMKKKSLKPPSCLLGNKMFHKIPFAGAT